VIARIRRHPWRCAGAALLAGFVLLNAFAYLHARSMTRFAVGGTRTGRPEDLGWFEKAKVLVAGVTVRRPENGDAPDLLGVAPEKHTFLSTDGTRLEGRLYRRPGILALAVLFHGYGAAKGSLCEEAREFMRLGWDVLLVDFRGSGGSDGRDTTIGFREALDVAAAIEYGRKTTGATTCVLYGRSMGAAAILRAIAHEGVRADGIIIESVFDTLRSTAANRFAAMGLPTFPAADLLVVWGGVRLGYNGFRHNPVEYAERVTCPALVLHGRNDPRARLEEGEAVFARLGGAKTIARLKAGHTPLLAQDPEAWRAAVETFLKSFGQND